MGKSKAEAPTLPRIRCMSCFDLTYAPVATTARADTGLVASQEFPSEYRLRLLLAGSFQLSFAFSTFFVLLPFSHFFLFFASSFLFRLCT